MTVNNYFTDKTHNFGQNLFITDTDLGTKQNATLCPLCDYFRGNKTYKSSILELFCSKEVFEVIRIDGQCSTDLLF